MIMINFHFLRNEAIQRRRQQRLTQKKLALLADLSTPTISHFESGKTNIRISSIMSILTVLGMVNK